MRRITGKVRNRKPQQLSDDCVIYFRFEVCDVAACLEAGRRFVIGIGPEIVCVVAGFAKGGELRECW